MDPRERSPASLCANPMRITIATGPMLPVPAILGGAIPRLWQGLAEEFAREGEDVCIFARAFPGQPKTEAINGVRYLRFGGFQQSLSVAVSLFKDFFYAGAAVWKLPVADVLVTNDFWLPVFCTYLRSDVGRVVVNANRFPKGQFRLYRRVARIAAASTAVRNAIVQQCPRLEKRTRVFANPVDSIFLAAGKLERTQERPRTVLFVGRIHPEKGVHLLVEAFARVAGRYPGWKLRIVGPSETVQGGGGPVYAQRLEQVAAGTPVAIEGPVFDRNALADVYCQARLFCYPTLADTGEAFGLAPLESMACGVPPLVSRLDCFGDYLSEEQNGWMFNHRAPDPVGELTSALNRLMHNEQALSTAGVHARATAQRFSYGAIGRSYLEDFRTLVHGGGGLAVS